MQNKTVVLVAALLLFYFVAQTNITVIPNPYYGETPEEIGDLFMDPNHSDIESFATLTEMWTNKAIKYRINIFNTHIVKSAQRAINEGYGDCSERAQVMHAILSSQNIPNTIIWGEISGKKERHAAVEVYYDSHTRILGDVPGFQKRGIGLTPTEYLVN